MSRGVGPFRLEARTAIAALLTEARLEHPPPARRELKQRLRVLLADLPVRSYRRRVVREEMRRAGAPFRAPPDFRQLEMPWAWTKEDA